ncbi:hypothetical protein BCT76_02785 [Vibrio tasmaniensis]|uniref:hypothetical protein n=1 Tax=Vibrio tasmaniensis TaxID=212663 RepID=UPI000C8578F5|nr:hypothetical protein [Vibrio tasmaniensis]PML45208.1 hypothetical protein BCT76_02785 [Vibrio tasmaniensis]
MHYLNNGSQVESVPPLKPRVGTRGYFTESNDDGSPSYPGQDWFNAVIREFQTALATSGVAFDPDKFDHLQRLVVGISQQSTLASNRLLGNQNANVAGKDAHPVPGATEYTYPVGHEIAAGWLALTECKITKAGNLLSGTGTYRRTIDGEFPDDYFGVKRLDNTQDQTGVELKTETGNTHIDVDLLVAGSHMFPGSSELNGSWTSIGDGVSEREYRGGYILESNVNGVARVYEDGFVSQVLSLTQHAASTTSSQPVTAQLVVPLSTITNTYYSMVHPDEPSLGYSAICYVRSGAGPTSITNVVKKAQLSGSFFLRTTVEGYL